MKMKKVLALILSGAMILSLAACGDSASNAAPAESAAEETAEETEEQTEEAEAPAEESEEAAEESVEETAEEVTVDNGGLNVCIASEPDTLDPAFNSAVDGATMLVHLFSGLAKWTRDENGAFQIVPDAAEELTEGVVNEDGTVTYTYTIRDMKWSDGQPVTANDFAFAWQRAGNVGTGGDYYYMFEAVQGYDEEDPEAVLNVKALDEKTLEVTLNNAVAYWNELLAFPVFFPVREDVVANESWATDASTYVCNGAYTITDWRHNSLITLTKNENYVDADEVTMPIINFFLSDDANNMLTNFKNGDWKLIDDLPNNEIASLKQEYPDNFKIDGQIGTYYVCWNVNEDILPEGSGLEGTDAENARAEIRNAISLLFDRNYIVNEIAQGGQVPASSFVAMGMTEPDGSEFYKNAGTSEDFDGYYNVAEDALEDNFNQAMEVLKKYYTYDEATGKFTDFPKMTYLYNTSDSHKAIGEYLQMALDGIGITMDMQNQEWATFLNTRKQGDYSIARNGWLADYNDPICFLDMWTTNSGNNDVQFGREAHAEAACYSLDLTDLGLDVKVENGTWAQTYDVLISAIKSETDPEKRFAMMHKAEDLLMQTGCICPLYFYTDLYMVDDTLQDFFNNPLGYKYFMYSHF